MCSFNLFSFRYLPALSTRLRECSCTLEPNKNGGNNSCCFHRNLFSLPCSAKERWKLKGLGHQGNNPHPSSHPPCTHAVSLFFGRVLVYSPYWAMREQIFGLDPSAFIMAPWWRTKEESDTIIPTLTSFSQHTWWASGGKMRNFNQRFLTSCSGFCCIWATVLSQVCVLCPWKSSSANAALLDWVRLQQVSSVWKSASTMWWMLFQMRGKKKNNFTFVHLPDK